MNAAAIGVAVLVVPALTGSATTYATPAGPAPAATTPVAQPVFQPAPLPTSTRFTTTAAQDVPDRTADREAVDHDDTLPAPPAGTAAPSNGSDFVSPVPGPITGAYGQRFHPILKYWRMHNGVDMTAACGTVVIAAFQGTVVQAGWNGGYGNLIVIDHGNYRGKNVISKYAHLSRIGVRVGDKVTTGQGIALSGTTGLSTGCHLHFEIKENGSYVDPAPYLTGKTSPRPSGTIDDVGPTTPTSPSPTATRTPVPTHSPTPTPTATSTRKPTKPPKPTPSPTTPSPSITATPTPSPTATPTPSESTPSPSASATDEPEPTASPSDSPSKEPTAAPSQSERSQPDPTPSQSSSSDPTTEPSRSRSASAKASPSTSGTP